MWVRLDDGFADDPQVIGLSDKAFRLYVRVVCYAARHRTDGRLPARAVEPWSRKASSELQDAGLLTAPGSGGFIVTRWREHLLSAAAEERRRKSSTERTRRWRERVDDDE